MPYIYLDKRKKPPVYRFQYWDYLGNRRSGTGTGSKAETEKLALQVQAREKRADDTVVRNLPWGNRVQIKGRSSYMPASGRIWRGIYHVFWKR